MTADSADHRPLRILHVLRAPLGGLFRHVMDLAREQAARGHAVGMIADSLTGGARAQAALDEARPALTLGVTRVPMRRNPHFSDLGALAHVRHVIRASSADVVHGHGSKGAVYARLPGLLPGASAAVRACTPHGGSFNYQPGSNVHRIYMTVEKLLAAATDIFLFESAFIEGRFKEYVGPASALSRVIVNGISPCEFQPVVPNADAAEFLYVGELRAAKGIDTLLDALAQLRAASGIKARAVLVGSGPDEALLAAQAAQLGLNEQIFFAGAMPARAAFKLGRVMIVPSRAESLPYVVLEAAGARMPLISTNAGGIPEIFGPHAARLIAPDDPLTLSARMLAMLQMGATQRADEAIALADYVEQRFSIDNMVDGVLSGYRDAIGARRGAGAARKAA